ncbi:MAG: PAS domain-containing protein [Verrucomicrobia bacterium]|nr:PAS domain-containing protein [Verrucomicrobiota bacterium]
MGASAGGLETFEHFFTHMPPDSDMAFVVVQHLDPSRASMMPELLQRFTRMKVLQARHRMAVQRNCVYLIPPNKDLTILNGVLRLEKLAVSHGSRLPIDTFFRSLAEDRRERAIGIILSGTGTDGTLGIKAIKEECGMVMVQEIKTAKYDGMPASAIDTGLVDYILPPDKMPGQLVRYAQRSFPWSAVRPVTLVDKAPDTLQKIFYVLRTQTGHDFSLYKRNTICRRIERRMNVHQIENAGAYLRFLQQNPQEVGLLFKELLIGVTNFFRDAEAFAALRRKYLPKLLTQKPKDYTVRVWVPGCSTGEEVYSIAIILRECLDRLKRNVEVQIFGTDIDSDAIETARTGAYPSNIVADVTAERLRRFFIKDGDVYRMRKDIREMVVFAPQNILKDPPFTKLDLLCCRNLLIYLDPELQKRVFPLFHYTLKPGGFLFLGSSESIGGFHEYFATTDKKWKIYQRRESVTAAPAVVEFPTTPLNKPAAGTPPPRKAREVLDRSLPELVTKFLMEDYSPACVLVSEKGDIHYIHGRTGKFLEPAAGRANLNIVEMAREGLRFELSAALRRARNQDAAVQYSKLQVRTNGGHQLVSLVVRRLQEPESVKGLLMVVFEEDEPPVITEVGKGKSGLSTRHHRRLAELEQELKYTKEHLQTTIEELETSNEELKSTNEELQSTNEELQSTNEELETSKEELHSLNEELVTVNTELQSKIDLLTQARDDMKNLLDSTKIATIYLDNNLCVKRFTAEATKVINLIQTDVGRPISHIVSNLRYDSLVEEVAHVLDTLVYRETRVQSKDGHWYLMRIMPYRTLDNVIDGVVITFVDIHHFFEQRLAADESQKLHLAAEASQRFAAGVVQTAREPMLVLDAELRVLAASKSFFETFRLAPDQTVRRLLHELGGGAWNLPRLRQMLEEIVPRDTCFGDFEVEHDFPGLGQKSLLLSARKITYEDFGYSLILLALEDVTKS